jgi:hypothetical protein
MTKHDKNAAEIRKSWIQEAERRIAAVAAGKEEVLPGDEVLAEIRRRSGANKAKGMTYQNVLMSALNLSLTGRRKLARKLFQSIEDEELQQAILDGAKLADRRIRASLRGKERTVSEKEIEELLSRKLIR